MLKDSTILNKKKKLPWRNIENNIIIVDLDREKVLDLDNSAKEIWELIDGKKSITDIAENLIEKYDISKQDIVKDIISFINELLKRELVYEEKS